MSPEHGGVGLTDRAGGHGLGVHVREDLLRLGIRFGLDHGPDLLHGDRWGVVLELEQFVRVAGGQHVRAGRDELA